MSNKDIAILKFVNESGNMASIGSYRQLDIAADARLEKLVEQGLIKPHLKDSDSQYAGDYEITGKGYAFLTDYNEGRKHSILNFFLTNVLLPTFIAWLTAFLTLHIK